MFRRGRQHEIARLDPVADHQRIVHLLNCYEFPWDMTRSLELALLRTFCSPRISALLGRTREVLDRTQKRYDDTDIIVSEMMEHGYDSERGREALQRMNALHGRFTIANEDFLYVLSTFVFEPIRWIDRFGWRRLTDGEREALFHFWSNVGRGMGITDIPDSYEEFERYGRDYEQREFRYHDANADVAASMLGLFVGWFPKPVQPMVRRSLIALMDEPMTSGFGLKPASIATRRLVVAGLKLRAGVQRCLPGRRKPRLRTAGPHRSYPQGYVRAQLGPE